MKIEEQRTIDSSLKLGYKFAVIPIQSFKVFHAQISGKKFFIR